MHIEYLTVASMDRRKGIVSLIGQRYLSYRGKKKKILRLEYFSCVLWNNLLNHACSFSFFFLFFLTKYSEASQSLRKCLFASNNLAFLKIRKRSMLCTCIDESLFRPNIVFLIIPQQQSTDNKLGLMLG